MAEWIEHQSDTRLPDWLKNELPSSCVYCGSPMLNFYNDYNRCTNRKCSNPVCPGFIAARADFCRQLVGIKGVGFKTCLDIVRGNAITEPIAIFPHLSSRPIISLDVYLRMQCYEGVDSEWEKIVSDLDIYTLDELFEKYDGKWRWLLDEKRPNLYDNLKYVTLKERPVSHCSTGPKRVYTIMITGTPIGFDSKDDFINQVNQACMGLIKVYHQKTKRQSDVDFLIREPGSTTRGKYEAALKGGIPIVTSEEFFNIIAAEMQSINA